MHMADALISPAVAGTMYACSTAAAGYALKKLDLTEDTRKIPMMGVMGAFVFSAQMINFTIPGTGSSGHIAGGMLLSAILGPYAGFITMIGVLLIQCLLFADGGILALGCNIWNMAFYGCFIGASLIWKMMMKNGISKRKIFLASVIGCVITLQLGAFSVVLQTSASGITELPFSVFVMAMQPIHLAIGLAEGLVTAAVLTFLYEAKPEVLWTGTKDNSKEEAGSKLSDKKILVIMGVLTVAIAGILSIFASALPDGLEWSLEKVAGTAELSASGGVYELSAALQNFLSVFADYSIGSGETAAGTSLSGVMGGLLVLVFCLLICKVIRRVRLAHE